MRKSYRRSLVIALVVLAIAVTVALYLNSRRLAPEPGPGPATGKLIARFLDVGQGDAEIIHLPDGETILIDSGDRGAPTDELLAKYGVTQIDLIFALSIPTALMKMFVERPFFAWDILPDSTESLIRNWWRRP